MWVDSNGGGISSTTGLEGCMDGGMQMHNGVLQHLYTCSPGTPAFQVCGTCDYPQPSGGASCPPGYQQDGLQCVIDQGAPGMCPPGSEYDQTLMCCSVTTGSGASYDLCAPGYSYVPGPDPGDPGSCVDYVAGGILCEADVVAFKTGLRGWGRRSELRGVTRMIRRARAIQPRIPTAAGQTTVEVTPAAPMAAHGPAWTTNKSTVLLPVDAA